MVAATGHAAYDWPLVAGHARFVVNTRDVNPSGLELHTGDPLAPDEGLELSDDPPMKPPAPVTTRSPSSILCSRCSSALKIA